MSIKNPNLIDEENRIPTPTEEQGCIRRGYCCKNTPGWFAPGELEKAAEHLGMTPDEFANNYLVIDGYELPELGWVKVFAPVRLNRFNEPAMPPLSEVDDIYRYLNGPCIFYKENGCEIYPARPMECRSYFCGRDKDLNIDRKEIAIYWYDYINGLSREDNE